MKQINLKQKSLLFMLVMLCMNLTAVAETVLIDGIYYDLRSSEWFTRYDASGNKNDQWYNNVALVTYNPDTEVTNPGSVETYQGDLIIPEKVTYNDTEYSVIAVNSYAFANCRSLTSVQLPSSVFQIYGSAFRYCTSLTSVTMPGVESLYYEIFAYSGMTTISLPKSLKYITYDAFNLSELTSITVDADNELFTSVDGVLYDKNITKIAAFPRKKTGIYKIPATISVINQYAFPSDVSLDELIIPATVTKIESCAFSSEPTIKKLTIEDSVDELIIGRGTSYVGSIRDEFGNVQDIYPMFPKIAELYWGRNLKYSSTYSSPFASYNSFKKIIFGSNVTSIPKYTFYSCYSINAVDVKGGIGQWCKFDFSKDYTDPFNGRTDVITVTFDGSELSGAVAIPNDVTSIPAHAFQYGCSKVTELAIHAGLTEIADGAFKGLSSLSTIQLASGNANFVVDDNVLYNKEKTKILCFPQLRAGDYTMPSTISEMGGYQFYNCINLTGITLSNTIKTINQYAFAGCVKLSTIMIPAAVETINDHAFEDCLGLTTFTIEDNSNLITIGQYAFNNDSSLVSLTVPASVENIENNAFDNCKALTTLVFEDGDKPLNLARYGSYSYQDNGNTYTNDCGIFRYSPIEKLRIGRNLIIPEYTGYEYDSRRYLFKNGSITRVEIGSKVTSIPAGFFYGCWNIREIEFDGTIIDWCNITFADQCATPFGAINSLSPILYVRVDPQPNYSTEEHFAVHSQVNIPEPAQKIGAYAFYGQRGVSSIIVPKTVKTIEQHAFDNGVISEVRIDADPASFITLNDANSFGSSTNIFIPDNAISDYRKDGVWSKLDSQMFPQGFLQVSVDLIAMTNSPALLPALNALEKVNGEYRAAALTNLKIRGSMNGYDIMMIRNKMPNLRELDLSEATILDNDGGYEYYQGYHTIPHEIGPYSFYEVENLRKVILPIDITSIDEYAFAKCSNLMEMTIHGNVKKIGYNAFGECSNLRNLTLAKGLETIESEAFSYCSNLRKLAFPTTLTSIGSYAFRECSSLTDIDFAQGLSRIGYEAFYNCSNLNDLHFPTSLKYIDGEAFRYCNSLSQVHLPSLLKEVGDYAFKDCGLKSVYAYTLIPIPINQNTFDYKGVDLYAPENSFYYYYLNTQWSQFPNIYEFPANYDNWEVPRDTDYEVNMEKPIKNADDNNPADGELQPGSGLIINGVGEQLVKNLIMNWSHGSNYPALIEDRNLSVEELTFILNVYPNRWYFFSFPYDVSIKDIKHNGKWVWRYYDGEKRAEERFSDGSNWKNVTGDVLKANVGYIFQSNCDGPLELPVGNAIYLNKEENHSGDNNNSNNSGDNVIRSEGTYTQWSVPLMTHESENPEDASWNFIGNPNLSYYGLDDMAADFDAPVTVWDPDQQTYTAVVPGDDDYDFHPFQAFFVQKPADNDEMTFRAENRATYSQTVKKKQARAKARGARRINENRLFMNLEISDGKMTDKTRVVFDDSKADMYDSGIDANKFLSMEAVPQIYTLDAKNVKYSVNNRPSGSREVRLGVVVPAEGTYTINMPLADCNMVLKDNETGTIHDFGKGAYTFLADAGTYENRFVMMSGSTTNISDKGIDGVSIMPTEGGIAINGTTDQPVNVYNLKGIRKATIDSVGYVSLEKGTYIVSMGGKSTKVVVK